MVTNHSPCKPPSELSPCQVCCIQRHMEKVFCSLSMNLVCGVPNLTAMTITPVLHGVMLTTNITNCIDCDPQIQQFTTAVYDLSFDL